MIDAINVADNGLWPNGPIRAGMRRAMNMAKPPRLPALILATLLISGWPHSALAARVMGYVRDADTQRYLYTEVHEQTLAADGSVQTGVTTYHDLQGQEMGRKTLDYRAHRTVPLYRLDIPAQRYAEGVLSNTGAVQVFKLDKGRETRETLAIGKGPVAADSGFNQLLMDQFERLKAGETFRFSLIVAGNTDQYRFRARQVGEAQVGGDMGLKILVEPDTMLRLLVDPIELVYDTKGTRLMSYRGVSNVLDPATGQVFKHIHIVYGGTPPPEARAPGVK